MHLRLMLLTCIVILSMLLLGCAGARELDENATVVALGLDATAQEDILGVSYQFAVPQMEGGKEDPNKGIVVITNNTSSLAEARNLLNSEIALHSSLAHIKLIVVGEELARKGLSSIFAPAMRYREYRGSVFVVVVKGTAKDFLQKNKPVFVTSMAKYYEGMVTNGVDSGYFLGTTLHEFYVRLKSHSAQPYMALVAINPLAGSGEISTGKVPAGKIMGYKAGDIPRQGGNPGEFAGTALFSGDKMVGTLSTTESRLLAMLLGKYSRGFLSVQDPVEWHENVNINLRLGAKPEIKATLLEGHPKINISILLEGDITSITSGVHYEEENNVHLLEEQINKVCQQEMINFITHTQQLKTDVVGFGYYLQPSFQSNQEFEDYKWNEKYAQAEINVKINTKIRRTGLMLRAAPRE